MILPLLPLLLASPLARQAEVPARKDRPIERVEMIVNDDILTLRQFQRELKQLQARGAISNEADFAAAASEVRMTLVHDLLAKQAGENMGFDPALVARQVDQWLERERERYDGVVGMSEFLQSQDLEAGEHRTQVEARLYGLFWEQAITGEGPSPSARVSVDSFVRPGLLRFEYNNVVSDPQQLAALGGRPQSVTIQILIVDPETSGLDVKAARRLAVDLRERALAGEDLAELNQQYGAAKRGFQPEPLDEARLVKAQPAVAPFLSTAAPGDLSEVIEWTSEGRTTFRLVRLVSRDAASAPSLASYDVQRRLSDAIGEQHAEVRKEKAYAELIRGSYVWPPVASQAAGARSRE